MAERAFRSKALLSQDEPSEAETSGTFPVLSRATGMWLRCGPRTVFLETDVVDDAIAVTCDVPESFFDKVWIDERGRKNRLVTQDEQICLMAI